jgi:hypothetical protein
MAGGLGFEPRLTESESAVLPLNYPPTGKSDNALRSQAGRRPPWRSRLSRQRQPRISTRRKQI